MFPWSRLYQNIHKLRFQRRHLLRGPLLSESSDAPAVRRPRDAGDVPLQDLSAGYSVCSLLQIQGAVRLRPLSCGCVTI